MKVLLDLEKIVDRFITDIGGNLDPRAACNRDRKALLAFVVALEKEHPTDVRRALQRIIDER